MSDERTGWFAAAGQIITGGDGLCGACFGSVGPSEWRGHRPECLLYGLPADVGPVHPRWCSCG